MAREVHIEQGKVYVGNDITLEFPIIDELTEQPIDIGAWAFEFVVRKKHNTGAALITKTTAGGAITVGQYLGVNALAKVRLNETDSFSGGVVLVSDLNHYTLRRTDSGLNAPTHFGRIWFTLVAGRG